jgi:hypothetical protein
MKNKLLKLGMGLGAALIAAGGDFLASGKIGEGVILLVLGTVLGGRAAYKHPPKPASIDAPIGFDPEEPVTPVRPGGRR